MDRNTAEELKDEAKRLHEGVGFIRFPSLGSYDRFTRVYLGAEDVTDIILKDRDNYVILAIDIYNAAVPGRDFVVPVYMRTHVIAAAESGFGLQYLIQAESFLATFAQPNRLATVLGAYDEETGWNPNDIKASNKRRRIGVDQVINAETDEDMEEAVPAPVLELPPLEFEDDDLTVLEPAPAAAPAAPAPVMTTDQSGYDNMRNELVEDMIGQGMNEADAMEEADNMMALVAVANADRRDRMRTKKPRDTSGSRLGTWSKVAADRRNVAAAIEAAAAANKKQQSTMERFLWPRPHQYRKPTGQSGGDPYTERTRLRRKVLTTTPDGFEVQVPIVSRERWEATGLKKYYYAEGLWDQFYRDNMEGRPGVREYTKNGYKNRTRVQYPKWWAKQNTYYPHAIRHRFIRDILQQLGD